MSCRHLLLNTRTESGEEVRLYRDCESRTYRLFVGQDNTDFTLDELTLFSRAVTAAVEAHEPFPEDDGDWADVKP